MMIRQVVVSPIPSLPRLSPTQCLLNQRSKWVRSCSKMQAPLSNQRTSRNGNGNGIGTRKLNFSWMATVGENMQPTTPVTPTSVPVRVAHELHQAGNRYLDVRTPEEFSAGHAVGAINVPYFFRLGNDKKIPIFWRKSRPILEKMMKLSLDANWAKDHSLLLPIFFLL